MLQSTIHTISHDRSGTGSCLTPALKFHQAIEDNEVVKPHCVQIYRVGDLSPDISITGQLYNTIHKRFYFEFRFK